MVPYRIVPYVVSDLLEEVAGPVLKFTHSTEVREDGT